MLKLIVFSTTLLLPIASFSETAPHVVRCLKLASNMQSQLSDQVFSRVKKTKDMNEILMQSMLEVNTSNFEQRKELKLKCRASEVVEIAPTKAMLEDKIQEQVLSSVNLVTSYTEKLISECEGGQYSSCKKLKFLKLIIQHHDQVREQFASTLAAAPSIIQMYFNGLEAAIDMFHPSPYHTFVPSRYTSLFTRLNIVTTSLVMTGDTRALTTAEEFDSFIYGINRVGMTESEKALKRKSITAEAVEFKNELEWMGKQVKGHNANIEAVRQLVTKEITPEKFCEKISAPFGILAPAYDCAQSLFNYLKSSNFVAGENGTTNANSVNNNMYIENKSAPDATKQRIVPDGNGQ